MWRAVALLDSSFFASWQTLLAGYCCRSAQPSFSVLETNSSSFRKNQNMSRWRILAVSGGVLA